MRALLLMVVALTVAGCALQTPASGYHANITPTVTLADPLARNALLQNEAYFAGLSATVITRNGITTQAALMQMTEQARQLSIAARMCTVRVRPKCTLTKPPQS